MLVVHMVAVSCTILRLQCAHQANQQLSGMPEISLWGRQPCHMSMRSAQTWQMDLDRLAAPVRSTSGADREAKSLKTLLSLCSASLLSCSAALHGKD